MKNEEMALLFSEATPYIQKYHGKTMVIKYGGNAMINETLKNAVMNDLVTLTLLGVRVVLVHGGGPAINEMLKKVGVESHFNNGLRVTDDATMEIVPYPIVADDQVEIQFLFGIGFALDLTGEHIPAQGDQVAKPLDGLGVHSIEMTRIELFQSILLHLGGHFLASRDQCREISSQEQVARAERVAADSISRRLVDESG